MATINSWNNTISSAATIDLISSGGTVTINSGTGAFSISNDSVATTVRLGTGAGVKTVTVGSTNTTSATTIYSGTGTLAINATGGGTVAITSGTGALSISNDATATAVKLGTGAGAKTVTVGSTNTTSSLALKYGTADMTLASATGTVMSALDTGEIIYGLQPAFLATHSADQLNITGNNTAATINYTTEVFDQNADYDGTNTFTAPVTGRFCFAASVLMSAVTLGTTAVFRLVTSNRSYSIGLLSATAVKSAGGEVGFFGGSFCDMDSADTIFITITINGIGADTADAVTDVTGSCFSGYLAC